MSKFLTKFDIFGHPISVLYKGQTNHSTILGSVFSLLTAVAVLIYAQFGLLDMVTRNNQEEKSYTITADLDKVGPINLEQYNFNLLFVLCGNQNGRYTRNLKIPLEYGMFKAYTVITEIVGDQLIYSAQDVPLVS